MDTNLNAIGWYMCNSGDTTHPVGQKQPNAWGLYDMAGNVWEWCHDWHQSNLGTSAVTDPVGSGSTNRLIRGGSWNYNASNTRAANRYNYYNPTYRISHVGFRCSRTK